MREKIWNKNDDKLNWKKFIKKEISLNDDKHKVNVAHLSGFVIAVVRFIEKCIIINNTEILDLFKNGVFGELLVLIKFLHFRHKKVIEAILSMTSTYISKTKKDGYFSVVPKEENEVLIRKKCCFAIVHFLMLDFFSIEIDGQFCRTMNMIIEI